MKKIPAAFYGRRPIPAENLRHIATPDAKSFPCIEQGPRLPKIPFPPAVFVGWKGRSRWRCVMTTLGIAAPTSKK
jgi:hypothetical protein